MRQQPAPKRVGRVRLPRRGAAWSIVGSAALVVGSTIFAASQFTTQIADDFDTNREVVETGIDLDTAAFDDGEMNILVLGSDAREDEEAEDQRSDTMMLVHIPESRDEMYVMSIMRDLWVEVPEVGMSKVNSAQTYGGYPLTIKTIEGLTGAKIDHMVVVDFDGFRDLTTALGGVEIDNDMAFSSGQVNPSFYPEGTLRLEGTDALRFVRERKAFIDGDYQRVKNQQKFLTAIAAGVLDSATLTNPTKISGMVSAFTPYLTVDESLDAETLVNYGMSMNKLRPSAITSFTIPNTGTGTTPGGASVVWPDEESLADMRTAMDEGRMTEFVEELEARLEEERLDGTGGSAEDAPVQEAPAAPEDEIL
ncbi:LCP family protein [Enteractinococcus coprophilus]|uniref:LytR family transcriptional attenuator n=1 Tax=Enteractinococcus coprophilus TaxID=1027633 RepID=A0A543AIM1_9MICC|nr:LCP family protein [Enteractinococcus coprophilus]TQL72415.1 LytR family transcriptional attenuator [Enteractinococcus coprophilus]